MKALLLALPLAAVAACSGTWPTLPTKPIDCVYFSITAPRTLAVGASAPLGAFQESCRPMFLPFDPNRVAWVSLDPSVLAVTGTSSVTGVRPGVAVLQGSLAGSSAQTVVLVGGPLPGAATPVSLRLIGPPAMHVGLRGSFALIQEMSNATFVYVTGTIHWHSSNPDVVGILSASENYAEIHAWRSGTATITATTSAGRMARTVRVE